VTCYFLESTAFAKLFVQEPGTDALIRLMEAVEDNRKLIAASAPLEVYAAIRRSERAGSLSAEDAAAALEILRMEAVEDNRKLISASTPLEVYAVVRRRQRAGGISAEDATAALDILRLEAARMVQQPLNPAVLEAARQLLDRTALRWPDALQLAAALVARDMFQGTEIIFVSASPQLLEAAKAEGFHSLDPAREAAPPASED